MISLVERMLFVKAPIFSIGSGLVYNCLQAWNQDHDLAYNDLSSSERKWPGLQRSNVDPHTICGISIDIWQNFRQVLYSAHGHTVKSISSLFKVKIRYVSDNNSVTRKKPPTALWQAWPQRLRDWFLSRISFRRSHFGRCWFSRCLRQSLGFRLPTSTFFWFDVQSCCPNGPGISVCNNCSSLLVLSMADQGRVAATHLWEWKVTKGDAEITREFGKGRDMNQRGTCRRLQEPWCLSPCHELGPRMLRRKAQCGEKTERLHQSPLL
jgi:hypothetical protein